MRRILSMLILMLLFATTAARAEWRRAESPNFVVYSQDSEAKLRERILLLEDFDRLLRIITSVNEPPSPTKLHVYIVGSHDDLELLRPTPEGVAGFYTATPNGIAAFVDASAYGGESHILLHEYGHHFMMQYRPNAYPAWYIEGFAEYFATVRFRPRYIDIGDFARGRINSIMSGWLPMERVLLGDSGGLNPDAMAAFYAQSWLTVHYFYSTPERQRALARYLIHSRLNPREALHAATGLNAAQFTTELRDYVRGGSVRMRRMARASAEAPPAVSVTMMPPAADDLMLFEAALRIGIREANEQPYLQRIRAAAVRFPSDSLAQRVHAHAELLYGEAATADQLLDPLIAARPNDVELLYLKGMRHLVAAEREGAAESEARQAREWFGRARRADGNHYQSLYRLARSARRAHNSNSADGNDALLRAHQLAPQVAEISMNAAAMHLSRGEVREALTLLRPLAANPHDPGVARAARQLLGQMRQPRIGQGKPSAAEPPEPAEEVSEPVGED